MVKVIVVAVVVASLAALPCAAYAGQAKAPLTVNATVAGDCTIDVDTPIHMPDYSYIANKTQDDQGEGEGHIVCSNGYFPKEVEFCDDKGDGYGDEYLVDFGLQFDLKILLGAGWGNTTGANAYFNIVADAAAGQNPPIGPYFGSTELKVDF